MNFPRVARACWRFITPNFAKLKRRGSDTQGFTHASTRAPKPYVVSARCHSSQAHRRPQRDTFTALFTAMALACDPRLCSHIEAAAKCTMSASASEPCAGHAPAHLMPLLDNCSECGLGPQLWRIHAVRGKRRAFPPRTQHVWCTGRSENGLRAPLTNAQLHTRYRASLRALEKAAPHESLCEIETAGNRGHVFEGRKLQSGLPVAVRNLRLLDGSDSGRATLRLTGPLLSGDTAWSNSPSWQRQSRLPIGSEARLPLA